MARYNNKPESATGGTHSGHGCSVAGCPLPGTQPRRGKMVKPWYCGFHAAAAEDDFEVITQRIQRYYEVIKHRQAVRSAGPAVCECNQGRYYKTRNAMTRKRPGENWSQYERRLGMLVERLIRGDEKPEKPVLDQAVGE